MKNKSIKAATLAFLSLLSLPASAQEATQPEQKKARIDKVQDFLKKMIDLGVFRLNDTGELTIDEEKLKILEEEGRLQKALMSHDSICG